MTGDLVVGVAVVGGEVAAGGEVTTACVSTATARGAVTAGARAVVVTTIGRVVPTTMYVSSKSRSVTTDGSGVADVVVLVVATGTVSPPPARTAAAKPPEPITEPATTAIVASALRCNSIVLPLRR